jgi:hypothetical protein
LQKTVKRKKEKDKVKKKNLLKKKKKKRRKEGGAVSLPFAGPPTPKARFSLGAVKKITTYML